MPFQPRRAAGLALVVVAALSLTACGRKGALEPPPGSPLAKQLEEDAKAKEGQNKMLGTTPGSGIKKVPRTSPPPKTPFILDPLID